MAVRRPSRTRLRDAEETTQGKPGRERARRFRCHHRKRGAHGIRENWFGASGSAARKRSALEGIISVERLDSAGMVWSIGRRGGRTGQPAQKAPTWRKRSDGADCRRDWRCSGIPLPRRRIRRCGPRASDGRQVQQGERTGRLQAPTLRPRLTALAATCEVRMKPILFLDFDGVLNSTGFMEKRGELSSEQRLAEREGLGG